MSGARAGIVERPRDDGLVLVLTRTHAVVVLGSVVLLATVLLPMLERMAVLAFLGAGMGIVFLARDRLAAFAGDTTLFMLPPLVAMLSAVTSLHPQETLWFGTQYAISALVFYALVLSVPPLVAMRMASLAICVGLVMSLLYGEYHHVGHTGEIAFVGIFTSKNNYSLIVGVLVVLGAGQCAAGGPLGRAMGLAFVAIGFAFLVGGRSLGAIVAASAAVGLAVLFLATRMFNRSVIGPAILVATTLALALGIWIAAEFDLVASRMVDLGRDPTLTGRTVLWDLAWRNFLERPLLGVGYRGYFVPHYPPAAEVLAFFHMPPDAAWHHHNAFFDILAGTGLLGVTAHALLLGRILLLFGRGIAREALGSVDTGIVAVFAYLALRSALEVDFTAEYALGLFLYALVHATLARRTSADAASGARSPVSPAHLAT